MTRLLVFVFLFCFGGQAFSQKTLVVLHRRPASQYVDTAVVSAGDQIDVYTKDLRVVGTVAYIHDSVMSVGDTTISIPAIYKIGVKRSKQLIHTRRVGAGILVVGGLLGIGIGASQPNVGVLAIGAGTGAVMITAGTLIFIRGGLRKYEYYKLGKNTSIMLR